MIGLDKSKLNDNEWESLLVKVVQNRFVVLIDQRKYMLVVGSVRLLAQLGKDTGNRDIAAGDPQQVLLQSQQFADANLSKSSMTPEQTGAETEPHANHRAAPAPVPLIMRRQAAKQGFVARARVSGNKLLPKQCGRLKK